MEIDHDQTNRKRARARRALPPVYELAAFSVYGFCLAHGLSRRKFYYMLEAGEGPRMMKCGTRTLISVEAAQALAAGPGASGRSITVGGETAVTAFANFARKSCRQSRVRTRAPTLSAV